MIEFTLNRNKNGKKSRWAKKYPRKKILKRGSEKAAGWYFHNWYDDGYHYFHGDLHKFLLKNAGRPVDKVFSEFLQRCRKGTEKYNLKERFYDMFKEKENIDYRGGFYLSNGIINYKKRTNKPKSKFYISIGDYNRQLMPDIVTLCKKCESSHLKQPIGVFMTTYNVQKRVYLIEREVWLNDLNLQAHYRLCSIYGVGRGVSKSIWDSQDKMYKAIYNLWDSWSWFELPEFVFITKIEKI